MWKPVEVGVGERAWVVMVIRIGLGEAHSVHLELDPIVATK